MSARHQPGPGLAARLTSSTTQAMMCFRARRAAPLAPHTWSTQPCTGIASANGRSAPAQRMHAAPALSHPPVSSMMAAAREAPMTMSSVSATNRPKAVMVTPTAIKVCRNLRGQRRGGGQRRQRSAAVKPCRRVLAALRTPWSATLPMTAAVPQAVAPGRVAILQLIHQCKVRGVGVALPEGGPSDSGGSADSQQSNKGHAEITTCHAVDQAALLDATIRRSGS